MNPSPTQGHDSESTVLTCFSVLFALGPIHSAEAGPSAEAAPMRPVTFVVDTRLSEGPVENFTDLAVDPYKLVAMLKPKTPASAALKSPTPAESDDGFDDAVELNPEEPKAATAIPETAPIIQSEKGDLLIPNERSYTATVAVNDTVIGALGPYTAGAIHNVPSGTYAVSFTHTSGYTYVEMVTTTQITGAIVPGGRGAAVALPNKGAPTEQ